MSTLTKLPARPALHGVVVLALVAMSPVFARAQTLADPMIAVASRTVDVMEADATRQKADALLATNDVDRWKQAARLLEKAASLRPVESPVAIQELTLSGQMFYYLGQLDRAQDNLHRAAKLALSNGRVLESAQLFLKAAYVADARGQPAEAIAFVKNAKRLAKSPHLSQEECDCIQSQIAKASANSDAFAQR